MNAEPTIQHALVKIDDLSGKVQDILDALNVFSSNMDARFVQVDKRFEQVDKRFEQVDKRFEQVDKRFEQVDRRFEQVDKRFEQIDEQFVLVHKEFGHVYEEFGILRSDFGNVARKSNTKLTVLVDSLVSEKSLDLKTAQRILALEPFAQGV